MFEAGPRVKIYIATDPQDMRKSFTGLAKAVSQVVGKSPQSGHLFAFLNRRRNLVKVLSWDQNGFCLLCKRLSSGVFATPPGEAGKNHVEITASVLARMVKARHISPPKQRVSFRDGRIIFTQK